MIIASTYSDWYIGMALAFFVIVVVVIIVAIILTMAARIADQASAAASGVDTVNDSAVRILHMARTLRKVAVGK